MEASDNASSDWRRPTRGVPIAGVATLMAAKSGVSATLLRMLFVGGAFVGALLCVLFAIFDQALFGSPASPVARSLGVLIGAFLLLAYPLFALFLPNEGKERKWDFASSFGAIALMVVVGQAVGFLISPYWAVAKDAMLAKGVVGLFTWPAAYAGDEGIRGKDVVLLFFFISAGAFLFLQRRAVLRFFRAMPTGVTLVTTSILAVAVGVLVPQIDGFEDPNARVNLAKEYEDFKIFQKDGYQKLPREMQDGHEQYQAFRWAEGYFLYHMLHLYGIGMPEAAIPPRVEESLDRFGQKYGEEEAKNRFKEMRAAFSGREKIDEIGAFIHRNETTFWRFFEVSTLLHLNRTYKSHWFASLLILLGISIFLSAYKGWSFKASRLPQGLLGGLAMGAFVLALKVTTALSIPWGDTLLFTAAVVGLGTILGAGVSGSVVSLQRLGFFVVHNGMLLLLVGGLTSKLLTDRGILHLFLEDKPSNTYFRHHDPDKPARMPFAVRLDHFARQDWRALEVHFLEEEFTSRPPRYTVWNGRKIELDRVEVDGELRPRLELEVLGIYDRTEVGLPFVAEGSGSEEGGSPLAEILVTNDGHGHAEGEGHRSYLPPMAQSIQMYKDEVFRDPRGNFRLASAYGADPGEHFPVVDGQLGFLTVTIIGDEDGAPDTQPIRIGSTLELPGGYSLSVLDASSDFGPGRGDAEGSTHPLPLESQPMSFTAIWVDIQGPDERSVERRLVLEAVDAVEQGQQDNYDYPDVRLQLSWDQWTAPGPPRYLLHWNRESKPSLIAENGLRSEVVAGERLDLPGDTEVIAAQLLHSAVFEKNVSFPEEPETESDWDADFYARDPSGIEVRITQNPGTADEISEVVKMSSTEYAQSNLWFSDDGRLAVRFAENSEMLPFEWRSVLSILEPDENGVYQEVPIGPEEKREIRVNDYFYYGGYRFFQTNAIAEQPSYSGIGVVYDPGIPVVLTGMYTIILGTMISFLLRPMVRGDGPRSKGTAREGTA